MSGERILITEDERITALDLKMVLHTLGYEVVDSVASGEESIEAVREHRPDLVLMDIHLKSQMLGTVAADVILRDFDVPVIFLTAYSDRSIIEKAGQSMPYGYLIKPYDQRELDAAIQVALAKHASDVRVRKSDHRLRLALEAAHMMAWEWQPEGRKLGIPDDADSPPQLTNDIDDIIASLAEDDRQHILDELEQHGRVHTRVLMTSEKDNDARHIEIFATVTSQAQGGKKVVGVARDVEDEHQRQKRLRQAQVVFEAISEAIIITNSDRKVISVNPAFERITGYPPEEVMGRDPDEFLHARRNSDQFSPRLKEGGSPFWSGEVACHTRDGLRFPAWEHVAGVFDDHGMLLNYVFTVSDIGELRRAEKSLAKMAYLDSLTGVGNRVHLERMLSDALREANEKNYSVAALYIDLDGFKLINDTLGHAEGDRLLQIIAERFVSSVREEDIVTRVGGDEFVIIVPKIDQQSGLQSMAEKLLAAIAKPIPLSMEVVEVSASIGIAVSEQGSSQDSLITAADTALFYAKERGKNCYKFYDDRLAVESNEKSRIERNMKGALNNQEICVEFQPLINVRTNSIYGAEALCRWYSNDMGVIPPERFIPIAEQSNVILELGAQVLEQSCRALKEWHQSGLSSLVVSVNVSARQLSDKNFPMTVKRIIQKHEVPAKCIELEITETAIQNNTHVKPQLDQLRELGVRFAIDDFGTGYSSLSRLKTLPFDRVKIDRSFVDDLPDDESDVEICRAIFALCDVLKLSVTAEGVENKAQLELLKDMGCGCAQGFLFGRAMPPERFRTWAREYLEKAI